MVVPVVCSFNEQWQHLGLNLIADVSDRLSERTACINATLPMESCLPNLLISGVLLEAVLGRLLLQLGKDLSEYRVFSLMVNLTLLLESLSLAPLYGDTGPVALGQ